MARTTGIEWTDRTWNPTVGCTAVSRGCDGCYAAADTAGRLNHLPLYSGLTQDGKFTGEMRLATSRLAQPLHWRKGQRIFVNSMSDVFHDGVPDAYIARIFTVMALAGQHTFQLLTKRQGRMCSLLNGSGLHQMMIDMAAEYGGKDPDGAQDYIAMTWPVPNLHLGVSVEDQKAADLRIGKLKDTPAAVRWLSIEPLLGPVNISQHLDKIDWVVVGGETGQGARPMHPRWVRSLRDQCAEARVPFFFKQWGAWGPVRPLVTSPGKVTYVDPCGEKTYDPYNPPMMDPTWCTMYQVGKKAAGRELDGQIHDDYPWSAVARV